MKNINPLGLFDDHFLMEKLTKLGDPLQKLNETLDAAGLFANEGKMVDASFVETPRQRNTREENKHIKETGTAPEKWKEKPHKFCQKDIDARWTKKNNAIYFGYKNHVKADVKTKLIEKYKVTDASVHDYLRCYFVVTSNGRVTYRKRRGATILC